jgi:hypothetical protein
MNTIKLLIIAVLFSFIGFAGGTYYGFEKGITNYGLLEQVVQGVLSGHQLALIKENKIKSVAHSLELNIDAGLHSYVMYQGSRNKMLSNYFMPELTAELDRYVDFMAEHRKTHPIVFNSDWALPVESDDMETKLWRKQGYKDSEKMLSEIKQLLKDRGVPESALTKSANE